jgi:glutamate formiminotransferase/formiminotetrahydrofolate cyclodeaminase
MKTAATAMDILKAMAESGNPNSVSDAGVGALAIRSSVMGAFLNVRINAGNLEDKSFIEKILKEGRELEASVCRKEAEILHIVESRLELESF